MSRIVVVGDIHEGINFGFNIDAETGISKRALDIHNNFAYSAKYAIKNNARLFIVLGDMFDRTHVSPTFRELIRRDVIEPLEKEGIEVWILAGNHDQPHGEKKGTSIDDFRGYKNVKVFRKPSVEEVEIEGKRLGFIIVPYLHPEQIARLVREREGTEIGREQMFLLGQKLLRQWISNRYDELSSDYKIMLGHYYLEGAKLRETSSPEVLPGEFSFTRDMIPQDLDLVVFGHVHLHQVIGVSPELVYTGAIERIDWGEREDKKGFVEITPLAKELWRFTEAPVRDMVKISLEIKAGEDATKKILDAIPDEVEEKMLRLEIGLDEGMRELISESRITEKLKGAFHYDVRWKELGTQKLGYMEFTMNPYQLLRTFLKTNYKEHPKYEQILKEGEGVLSEVLG
ncbi:MAG: metallophosphoesterase [Methanomassiliicoccales archaeon]|nr:MAG: metallophosphoesterase [Methanomassiliicoccales archaeon]